MCAHGEKSGWVVFLKNDNFSSNQKKSGWVIENVKKVYLGPCVGKITNITDYETPFIS